MLHVERRGSGRPLVMVHGFTQSGRAWGPAGDTLARSFELLLVDAPGHGRSAEVRADLPGGAAMMAAAVAATTTGPAAWLGYSMGGRYALHVALDHPGSLDRLILVSTTAGIDDPAERASRRDSDEQLARRLEQEGLEPFLRWWLDQPMWAGLPPSAAQMDARLEGSAAGLAASLRLAGAGTQVPQWDRLGAIDVPVLVITGGEDRKYTDLGRRLAQAIGANASHQVIAGAGHACHLEQPDRFAAVVAGWLGGG